MKRLIGIIMLAALAPISLASYAATQTTGNGMTPDNFANRMLDSSAPASSELYNSNPWVGLVATALPFLIDRLLKFWKEWLDSKNKTKV